jgi:hypothetical protein
MYSEEDYVFGFNIVQTTMGTVAELAGFTIKVVQLKSPPVERSSGSCRSAKRDELTWGVELWRLAEREERRAYLGSLALATGGARIVVAGFKTHQYQ